MSEQAKFLNALGKNINKLRKSQGLSFQEMALRCDMEKGHLVRLTSQGANITVITLHKISKGLNIPLTEIFNF